MAKNIEIQINNGSNSYEILYPKVDLTNNQGTSLPISSTSGNLSVDRLDGIITKAKGGTGTSDINGGRAFYYTYYTGTGTAKVTTAFPNLGLTLKVIVLTCTTVSILSESQGTGQRRLILIPNFYYLDIPDGQGYYHTLSNYYYFNSSEVLEDGGQNDITTKIIYSNNQLSIEFMATPYIHNRSSKKYCLMGFYY